MFEWSEELKMVRDAVRTFVDTEIRPHREELEHGDLPPYDLLRKLYKTFGMDQMAADSFDKRIARRRTRRRRRRPRARGGVVAAVSPCCRSSSCASARRGWSPRWACRSGSLPPRSCRRARSRRRSVGPATSSRMDKIGAWAITEPGSGSDAFGSMAATAPRDGDEYVLNGSKTFITNGPYADTIVFICKLDEGNEPADRKVVQFVLDTGMPGLEQSKPLRKMGLHSSPTGMLFLDDVRCGRDRLLGESEEAFGGGKGREASKATFVMERSGVAAMALGIVERCLELCVKYAKERVQFGRPIGEFQLIQLKLAKMEVARLNIENLVFRVLESSQAGQSMTSVGGVGDEALRGAVPRPRSRSKRCSSSAATATWPSTRSSSSRATRRCCRSTPAPTRSRSARSRGASRLTSCGRDDRGPVEPAPSRWDLPDPRRRGTRRRGCDRWRPRTRHGARRVPTRPVPDAARGRARVVVARSAGRDPARRLPPRAARCAAPFRVSKSASTPRSRR